MVSSPYLALWLWLIFLGSVLYRRSYSRTQLLALPVSLIVILILFPFSKLVTLFGLLAVGFGLSLYFSDNFRYALLSAPLLEHARMSLPTLSDTEQVALNAGHTWWESEVFQGMPNWQILKNYPTPNFSAEEQAFLDGPVLELCRMIHDWELTHHQLDFPEAMWTFLKEKKFFALIIPKKFGGLEFSASAHSEVVHRIASKSFSVASTVCVPNSLGPAELLLHYGTTEQKDYYLPRLAIGEEIPCFALTSPEAGSDAGSIPDFGVVKRGLFQGEETTGILLQFDKRYITLAPVATVIGLAFKLYDPEHLIGTQTEYGITCALIPRETPGVEIGQRHFPLNAIFQNGPIRGKDVFIPLDWIIGGLPMVGQGWRMLVECLSAGRAISLPATTTGGAKLALLATSAYARIRNQFNQPLSAFDGVGLPLADMATDLYLIEAARTLTARAVDMGIRPTVASAIIKYHVTEIARRVSIIAMDIHGGKGICMGPKNYLARSYQGAPIAITVEGANILTRNMIIFGQGAVRCHPYLIAEMAALHKENPEQSLEQFDQALMGHVGYFLSNGLRALWLGLTRAHLVDLPEGYPIELKREIQCITYASTLLAFISDVALIFLGGKLKRQEALSARLGDMLSALYLSTLSLKRYLSEGSHKEDLPVVKNAILSCLQQFQSALDELLLNFPGRFLRILLVAWVFPTGKMMPRSTDDLRRKIVGLFSVPSKTRERLTTGLDLEPSHSNPVGYLESAFPILIQAADLEKKVRKIIAAHPEWPRAFFRDQIKRVRDQDLITAEEFELLELAEKLRADIIAVDAFDPNALLQMPPVPVPPKAKRKAKTALKD